MTQQFRAEQPVDLLQPASKPGIETDIEQMQALFADRRVGPQTGSIAAESIILQGAEREIGQKGIGPQALVGVPGHAKLSGQQGNLATIVFAIDPLQRNDIRCSSGNHIEDPVGGNPAITSATAINLVCHDADGVQPATLPCCGSCARFAQPGF
jgi:hypothetical protein